MGLHDREGNWKSDANFIVTILEEYFGFLFNITSPSEDDLKVSTRCINKTLFEVDLEIIFRLFTGEDVRSALLAIGPTKARGRVVFMGFFTRNFGILLAQRSPLPIWES